MTTDLRSTATSDVRVEFSPPPVTIIIPSYNRVNYLLESITSCLAQDYPHRRIVVADDGSTDETVQMVEALGEYGVELVTGPHAGAPVNRNRGLATVSSPYVLWIGDDDVLVHDVLSRRIDALRRFPAADVIHGDTMICDSTLEPTQLLQGEDWSSRRDELVGTLFRRNVIADAGSLISMAVYARAGWYDPAFPKGHDYHLWSRAVSRCTFRHDPHVGVLWRWHGSNMGLGGGTNPYADAHRRIVLEMWSHFDKRLLFPGISWGEIPESQHDAVGAVAMAERLMVEQAWDDAARFVSAALALGAGEPAQVLAAQLAARPIGG